MPLYTYRCEKEDCHHSIEKIVKYDERENKAYDCEQCGTEKCMKFEMFTPGNKGTAFNFKGNWFNTTGRY
jgi:predicted nucleic acid-binding Zn ribbon protein